MAQNNLTCTKSSSGDFPLLKCQLEKVYPSAHGEEMNKNSDVEQINREQTSQGHRKQASVRERSRMRDMNGAFDRLRTLLEHVKPRSSKKLSKIQTLRFAIQYLSELENMADDVEYSEFHWQSGPNCFQSTYCYDRFGIDSGYDQLREEMASYLQPNNPSTTCQLNQQSNVAQPSWFHIN